MTNYYNCKECKRCVRMYYDQLLSFIALRDVRGICMENSHTQITLAINQPLNMRRLIILGDMLMIGALYLMSV